MSQMQRPNPVEAARRGYGGSESQDPKEKLNLLQIELAEQNARLQHLGTERDNLQTDITDLTTAVSDMQSALTDYAGKVKTFEDRLHALRYFYDQKHKMVMAAIGDKKEPIDDLIAEVDGEIERMSARLEELGRERDAAAVESQNADSVQNEKENAYNWIKNYKTQTDAKLTDLESLRSQITAVDDANDIASMYFEVVEFDRVLDSTHVISQHQLAQELRQKLSELEAAKAHARAKSAAWNALKTEYDSHQKKLQDKIDSRRQQLLSAVQALFPVPHPSSSGAATGGTATGPTGTGSTTTTK